MGDDADDLFVTPFFGFVQLLGQRFHHVERVRKAPVHEGRQGAAVDVERVGLEDTSFVWLQGRKEFEQGQWAVLKTHAPVRPYVLDA